MREILGVEEDSGEEDLITVQEFVYGLPEARLGLSGDDDETRLQ